MPRRRSAVVHAAAAVLVAASALSLPGCFLVRQMGLVPAPKIEIGEAIARDFELTLVVTDQLQPAADTLVTIRRGGDCNYRVTLRAPQRGESQGRFQITEAQVVTLWNTLRETGYTQLDARYPEDGVGPDKAAGIQAFGVTANDLAKEVQAHFVRVPELERVKAVVMSVLPPSFAKEAGLGAAPGAPAGTAGTSRQIVGDIQSRIFYPADDARLKDVPADRRQPFGSWFDAINFGFSPAPGFRPWENGR